MKSYIVHIRYFAGCVVCELRSQVFIGEGKHPFFELARKQNKADVIVVFVSVHSCML